MTKPEIWTGRFYVNEKFAPTITSSGKYILPASHLSWYESPLDAAERTIRDQTLLPLARDDLKLLEVQTHVSGDTDNEAQPPHWDICFLYTADIPRNSIKTLSQPEWFNDFGFVQSSILIPDSFARGHGDVLDMAGLIGPRSAVKPKAKRKSSKKKSSRRK